ncbi:Rha family transcriptional regulator [Niallia sp. FSL R7-0648]|uniref:Rha family transcriptional regulator n=1 Tax=Niallia sp. FSL R7-0648 TaxID=2954521 RepID=UPI0030F799AE
MSQLVFVNDNQVFTDSLTVAEVFGKRHDVVLRDIRNLECSEEFNLHNFAEIDYTDERNRTYKKYLIKRDGLAFLVFGYTGAKAAEYKEKYIQAFNAMEEELRKPKVLTDREQRVEALKLTLEHEEKLVEYDGRLSKLEDNVRIDSFAQNALQKQIKKRVYKVFETANPNGLDLKKLFPCIHRNFRDAFGVPTYRDLRKLDYEEAISWVKTWRPLI